ncbi:hypothetical protein BDP27DRAFT_1332832 [Rhodocollybia butyracea]|uniref:Uncharacterized protein n=1 Tax=Rhodocollybia butyracea TaxID=206335 RepID=A0A9P5PKJ8_9AGAR|nr:hypothetical protein BDP27DRAFT_1332832 [Rhodocollybia butyracea]
MTLFFPTLLAQSTESISCVSGNLSTPMFFTGLQDARCKYCQSTKEDTLSYTTYSTVQSYYYYYLWDVNDISRLPSAAWPGLLSKHLDLGMRDEIMRRRSNNARVVLEGDDSEDEFSDSSSEGSKSRSCHYVERYQLSPEV